MNKSKVILGNSIVIRKWNLSSIFKSIRKQGPISRIELTKISGCSTGTVSNHVRTLMKKGFVIETKKGISSGGRKPIQLMKYLNNRETAKAEDIMRDALVNAQNYFDRMYKE